jgi:hypothetical protein
MLTNSGAAQIVPATSTIKFTFLLLLSDYGLDDRGSIPDRGRGFFSSSPCVQTGSGAHPASYPMGTGGPFLGGKARPRRDVDHSPPSSAEVNNE